jgi:hypothetical protein
MKRLDHVSTRTRLARRDASTTFRLVRGSLDKTPRLPINLRLARPRVRPVDPPHSQTLRQKSEHLIQTVNHFPTLMTTATTCMGAVPVSNLTFYRPSRDGGENLSLYAPYWALFRH